jgi:hypothetical protein
MISGEGVQAVSDACMLVWQRNMAWVSAARKAVVEAERKIAESPDELASVMRSAFEAASSGRHSEAVGVLQTAVDRCQEPLLRGWLKYELASFIHSIDVARAQVTVASALKDNGRLPRPMAGFEYSRIINRSSAQGVNAADRCRSLGLRGNELSIHMNGLVSDLQFAPDSWDKFEEALLRVGLFLGFSSQRPERQFGVGPDVMWSPTPGEFWLLPCKNEATLPTVPKRYADQVSGLLTWFAGTYGATDRATPILVHPTGVFAWDASVPSGCRAIDTECLGNIRKALVAWGASVAPDPTDTVRQVQALTATKLTADKFLSAFTIPVRQEAIDLQSSNVV